MEQEFQDFKKIRDSLMVRIRACRVRDRGSIPRRGGYIFFIKNTESVNFVTFWEVPNEKRRVRLHFRGLIYPRISQAYQ